MTHTTPDRQGLTGPVSDQPSGPFGLQRREYAPPSHDLADLSDSEFKTALERAQKRSERIEQVFDSVLIRNLHFGNPRNAFKQDILLLDGANDLIGMFKLQFHAIPPGDEVVIIPPTYADGKIVDPGFVSVTVHYKISMSSGAVSDEVTANCNSREKRFKKFNSKGYTYEDARETIHDCTQIARKRAKVTLVRDILGLGKWLKTEEEAETDADEEKLIQPWSKDEERRVYTEARKHGIDTRGKFTRFVLAALGRTKVGTDDVDKLIAAMPGWKDEKPGGRPVVEEDDLAMDRAIVEQESRGK